MALLSLHLFPRTLSWGPPPLLRLQSSPPDGNSQAPCCQALRPWSPGHLLGAPVFHWFVTDVPNSPVGNWGPEMGTRARLGPPLLGLGPMSSCTCHCCTSCLWTVRTWITMSLSTGSGQCALRPDSLSPHSTRWGGAIRICRSGDTQH